MKERQSLIFEVLPQTLKTLREEKKWSQGEVASRIGVNLQRISKYERGEASPPADVLLKLADLFRVSLDYLMRGREQISLEDVKSNELLRRFVQVNEFNEEKQKLVIDILDIFIVKEKLESENKRNNPGS